MKHYKRYMCVGLIVSCLITLFSGGGPSSAEVLSEKNVETVSVAVIMYHQFFTQDDIDHGALNDNGTILVSEFEDDLKFLSYNGYTTITASDLVMYWNGEHSLPEKCVMITIDDCNYSVYRYAWPLLLQYGLRANCAIIGAWSDEAVTSNDSINQYCSWDDIKEMASTEAIEFGSHSYYMHSQKNRYGTQIMENETLTDYREALISDMKPLNEKIMKTCGYEPVFFAYPYSRVCDESIKFLQNDLGYKVLLAGDGEKVRSTKANSFVHDEGQPYVRDALIRRFARHKGDNLNELLDTIFADALTVEELTAMVSEEKASIGLYSDNVEWVDLTECIAMTYGSFIRGDNGKLKDNKYFAYSELIPVTPGEVYAVYGQDTDGVDWSLSARGGFFSATGEWMEAIPCNSKMADWNVFTIPNEASFMRVNICALLSECRILRASEYEAIWSKNNSEINYVEHQMMSLGGMVVDSEDYAMTSLLPVAVNSIIFVDSWCTGFPQSSKLNQLGCVLDQDHNWIADINSLATKGHMEEDKYINNRFYTFIVPPNGAYIVCNTQKQLGSMRIYECKSSQLVEGSGRLAGRKWSMIGDSVTFRDQWTWPVMCATGITAYNHGLGSQQLCGEPSSYRTRMWESSILQAVIADDPDIVTIMGGLNDQSGDNVESEGENKAIQAGVFFEQLNAPLDLKDKTTYYGAMSYIIETLLNWKPNLEIVLVTPISANPNREHSITGISLYDVASMYKDVASYYHIHCADVMDAMLSNYTQYDELFMDGVHLTYEGAKLYASIIRQTLLSIK